MIVCPRCKENVSFERQLDGPLDSDLKTSERRFSCQKCLSIIRVNLDPPQLLLVEQVMPVVDLDGQVLEEWIYQLQNVKSRDDAAKQHYEIRAHSFKSFIVRTPEIFKLLVPWFSNTVYVAESFSFSLRCVFPLSDKCNQDILALDLATNPPIPFATPFTLVPNLSTDLSIHKDQNQYFVVFRSGMPLKMNGCDRCRIKIESPLFQDPYSKTELFKEIKILLSLDWVEI